ncbi:MAG TPA: OmpA family protein [Thermoanaerobaculia bacterium]
MRAAAVVLFLLILLSGCSSPEETVSPPARLKLPPAPTEVHVDSDIDNLLNIAYGASVVHRTGEHHLEQSAVHAIDGIGTTAWFSPPGGASQTMLFSLPTESRIERLGVSVTADVARVPAEVKFEISADGELWREVLVMKPEPTAATQLEDILHSRATHLRVSTGGDPRHWAVLRSIHAVGHELSPVKPRTIAGCWTVNEMPSTFMQQGASVIGEFRGERGVIVDGGISGPVVRLMWMRGPLWGYAALTLAPDSRTLSALTFHEEMVVEYAGAAWFGERVEECEPSALASPAQRILDHARRWSMFGLAFDDHDRLVGEASRPALDTAAALIAAKPSSRFAIVVHEYRSAESEENRRHASVRADEIRTALTNLGVDLSRVEFEAAGSERNIAPVTLTIQRLLSSRADLELRE